MESECFDTVQTALACLRRIFFYEEYFSRGVSIYISYITILTFAIKDEIDFVVFNIQKYLIFYLKKLLLVTSFVIKLIVRSNLSIVDVL